MANTRPPSIGKIDLDVELPGGVAERIRLRHAPSALTADQEYVWVGSADGTLSRIDPVSEELRTVEVGDWVRAFAVRAGAVWVVRQPPPGRPRCRRGRVGDRESPLDVLEEAHGFCAGAGERDIR